jgi:hypothetical protein
LQRGAHPFGNRFPLDREPALPGRSAMMRNAQEIERLRLPLSVLLTAFRRKTTELDEPGLFRVKLKTELLQALVQLSEETSASIRGRCCHRIRECPRRAPNLPCIA